MSSRMSHRRQATHQFAQIFLGGMHDQDDAQNMCSQQVQFAGTYLRFAQTFLIRLCQTVGNDIRSRVFPTENGACSMPRGVAAVDRG